MRALPLFLQGPNCRAVLQSARASDIYGKDRFWEPEH